MKPVVNSKLVIILDLVRIVNVLNLTLISGLFLFNTSINIYVSIVLVLVFCAILSNASRRIIQKKLNTESLISDGFVFSILSSVINILMLIYFLYVKDYINAAIFVSFFIVYYLIMRKTTGKTAKSLKRG